MSIAKQLNFDLFMVGLQAQSQKRVFEILAQETAPMVGTEAEGLLSVFQKRLSERTFGMGNGIAIFDVKSPVIQKPVLVMSSFEQDIDFNALDSKPVNIMAAVLSPQAMGAVHLQRLACVSRVLRSNDLCAALKDAQNVDQMRVLFMPTQDWMVAA